MKIVYNEENKMRKIILKTTSVFTSLAMIALLGAPAYATVAKDENVYEVSPEVIESVVSDIAGEEEIVAAEPDSTAVIETENPPAVCDHSCDETDITDETETAENEDEPCEAPEAEESVTEDDEVTEETETSEDITTDEILDYIDSEEFQDALVDAGVDSGVVEEEIEDGNYEIIYITPEEFEQMRKEHALSYMSYSATLLGESMLVLLLIPAVPFLFFIPFAGPFAVGGVIFSPVIVLSALVNTIISPVRAYYEYKNYELDPRYEIVE